MKVFLFLIEKGSFTIEIFIVRQNKCFRGMIMEDCGPDYQFQIAERKYFLKKRNLISFFITFEREIHDFFS